MKLEDVINSYKNIISTQQAELKKVKSKIFQIGSIRLTIVLICAFCIYYFWFNVPYILLSIFVCAIIFLLFMKYHNKLFYKKQYCELLIENAENELNPIDYNFSDFDDGVEYTDPDHSYSTDLDLFGKRSFFQSINRTVTTYGKNKLADRILHPSDKKDVILSNQTIIKELSEKFELTNHFRAIGQMSNTLPLDVKHFADKFEKSKPLAKSRWRFTFMIPICCITIFYAAFQLFNLPDSSWMYLYILLLSLSSIPFKMMKEKMASFDKRIDSLKTYAAILKIIEEADFKSPELKIMQEKLTYNAPASTKINGLLKLSHNFDQSFNVLGLFILNPLLFWNVIYAIKIEKWVYKNKDNIDQWFATLGEFDSFLSLAIFAYTHPDYTYPKVADNFIFEGKELGHPLLHRDKCVTNDVNICHHPYFLVVTGANMAGKSTYLRTVGLNLTLANMGAPVFAKSLKFYPFHLVTNLRTSDSLNDNESYFFAELKRLKMIIDRLESGEELFIILDEILKGTNSEDKQKGSIALMKQLIANKGCGIIATHDLVLGDLEKEYPNEVKNYRFEADITNEELTFTYKIREGIAQNMNACFLMSKMGITGLR